MHTQGLTCQLNAMLTLRALMTPNLYALHIPLRSLSKQFLGANAKLRKTTISFVVSIRLSVRMEKLVSQWMDFHEI